MKMQVLGIGFAIALAFLSFDAMAMCGGGGGMRVGGHSGGSRKTESAFKKWDLPSPEAAPALDTSKWDAFARTIDLSTEQADKVTAARQKIQGELADLTKAQDESRSAYQKCSCETSARVAAGKVASSAQALKGYDPNARFASALSNILSFEQMKQYRDFVAKG